MIKFINSWAQGIILAVIIATIIEIILPEGKNKKYWSDDFCLWSFVPGH